MLLLLQRMRRVAEAHNELLPDDVEKMFEEDFGVVDHGVNDKLKVEPLVTNNSKYALHTKAINQEDIDQEALLKYMTSFRVKPPPANEVPKKPPPPEQRPKDMVTESRILKKPEPGAPFSSKGTIIIDADATKPSVIGMPLGRTGIRHDNKTRLIWITEPSGIHRTPTWEERRYIIPTLPQPNRKPWLTIPHEPHRKKYMKRLKRERALLQKVMPGRTGLYRRYFLDEERMGQVELEQSIPPRHQKKK